MQQLSTAGRTNFLYTLAKGLGTRRSDGEDSVFPVKQLIAGLFEYSANFFVSVHKSQVHTYIDCVLYTMNSFPVLPPGCLSSRVSTVIGVNVHILWQEVVEYALWSYVEGGNNKYKRTCFTSQKSSD